MENAKRNKERKLIALLVAAWVIAATLGGCVVSLNIQKNNSNSEQKVEQSQMATQRNDSTNFKFDLNGK
jgi:flagellar basal body-associated protein FliL